MLELPEVLTISKQLDKNITGKVIDRVYPPTKPHKFCWFNGDPADYEKKMKGHKVAKVEGFGIYVDICLDNGYACCINDGIQARYVNTSEAPSNYQLMITFTDNTALYFVTVMYGGIVLHDDTIEDSYYLRSKAYVSPFSKEFSERFELRWVESKPSLSAKAFIATEQRFPGVGNGVAQDILFQAGIHPKRHIGTFSKEEKDKLFQSMIDILRQMTDQGGRDTEKDIFGVNGGYKTIMSKNSLAAGCPKCGGEIVKEAYLGGSVYYCPKCQPK